MIVLPEFDEYRQKYASMKMERLRITLVYRPGAARQNYDPTALDGLLASQVVRRAVGELATVPDAYDIPLPLKCLWRNESGLPLWAASYFWPESDDVFNGRLIVHKRAITGRWSRGRGKAGKLTINRAAGKHKEKRIPVPIQTTLDGRYAAYCIGNADAIAELLTSVVAVSGRRGMGLGEVEKFHIESSTHDVLVESGKLLRAVPAGAINILPLPPTEPPVLVGWTPPQWKPSLFSYGWPAGTRLGHNIDWFSEGI